MSDIGHYDKHPAYRNQSLLVGDDIKWGRDRNNTPNFEVEVGRTIMPWFGGTFTGEISPDLGVNMVAVLFDWFTDQVSWFAIDEAILDETSWTATRDHFVNFRISPLITDQSDGRSHVAKLFEYGDLWLRRAGSKIECGYWQQGNINTALLPVIGSDDLTGEPDMDFADYDTQDGDDACYTHVTVAFKDREHFFHDAVATYKNPGLIRIIGGRRPITLQREHLTDATLSSQYASQYGQRFGRPGGSGSLPVKIESVEAIEDSVGGAIVGELVKWDSGALGLEFVLRVIKCRYPADGGASCTLTVQIERSVWPSIYIQPPPKKIGNFIVDVPEVINHLVFELPAGYTLASNIQLAVLGQRPAPNIVGMHVHSSTDGTTYIEAPKPCVFGPYGTLTADYSATGPTDDTTGFTVDLRGVDLLPDLTRQDKLDHRMLIFFDDGTGEMMAAGDWTALGAGIYRVPTLRNLYGTTKSLHPNGTKVYFILREQIVPITNKNFAFGATLHFKLQPYDTKQDFDLADVTAFDYTFSGEPLPDAPTGLDVTAQVEALLVEWDQPTDPAVVATEILFDLTGSFPTAAVIATVPAPGHSFLWPRANLAGAQFVNHFFWVRFVNHHGNHGDADGPDFGIPIVPAAVQCATPEILVSNHETGDVGDNDFRVKIVDSQVGGSTIYFAIYKGDKTVLRAFGVYSKTGNYQGSTGSVLPTTNEGEISCAQNDYVIAYATKASFLQSASARFNNNPTDTPDADGGGGTGGSGGLDDPKARLP